MKKISIPFFAVMVLGTISILPSCKKCVECSYRDPVSLINRSREECGNRETIDHFKQDVYKEAKAFGLEEKDVTCKQK
ncbi:MAG: hypothetical protein N2050_08695 [Flavobacteriales bacterium]|nr:hypothetical protein [Flavobacteriales bacterium]MCX7650613.1 hypothetical protein [Flavobacteriales bacterium]MDW8431992.1 hypothetical protein [Flavobacteriales bacterium]